MPYRKEDGTKLNVGDVVKFGPGPRLTTVDIFGDNFAMVSPPDGRDVYVGNVDKKTGHFREYPMTFMPTEGDKRRIVERQSISGNQRRMKITWTKK